MTDAVREREAFDAWASSHGFGKSQPATWVWEAWQARAALSEQPSPIDMVLHCPVCGVQHIDAPEFNGTREDKFPAFGEDPAMSWTNPPHRSHLCHGCGHIWRPADVPTNGVAAVKTQGMADSPLAMPARRGRT